MRERDAAVPGALCHLCGAAVAAQLTLLSAAFATFRMAASQYLSVTRGPREGSKRDETPPRGFVLASKDTSKQAQGLGTRYYSAHL